MVPETEKQIGVRLRAFRETLQIPRSKFAVAIGYGSERIASYEAGRAPLPYEVFRATTKRYHISPLWLATQVGSPIFPNAFDDSDFASLVPLRALFSEVYDEYIAPQMRDLQSESKLRGGRAIKALDMVPRILDDESIPLSERRKWASELESQIRVIVRRMRRDLKLRRKSEQISVRHFQPGANPEVATFESKDILDIPKQPDKFPAVRLKVPKVPTWEQLKKEIARFTAKRGEKAALAAKLGVSRQVLGNWLSSDDQGTPNANLSLKLLDWFYNKMNEPKSSEPAQTSSEPKIRTMKSSYEKHNPNQA